MKRLPSGSLRAVPKGPILASRGEKDPEAPAEESAVSAPSADSNAEPAAKTIEAYANIQN